MDYANTIVTEFTGDYGTWSDDGWTDGGSAGVPETQTDIMCIRMRCTAVGDTFHVELHYGETTVVDDEPDWEKTTFATFDFSKTTDDSDTDIFAPYIKVFRELFRLDKASVLRTFEDDVRLTMRLKGKNIGANPRKWREQVSEHFSDKTKMVRSNLATELGRFWRSEDGTQASSRMTNTVSEIIANVLVRDVVDTLLPAEERENPHMSRRGKKRVAAGGGAAARR